MPIYRYSDDERSDVNALFGATVERELTSHTYLRSSRIRVRMEQRDMPSVG